MATTPSWRAAATVRSQSAETACVVAAPTDPEPPPDEAAGAAALAGYAAGGAALEGGAVGAAHATSSAPAAMASVLLSHVCWCRMGTPPGPSRSPRADPCQVERAALAASPHGQPTVGAARRIAARSR